MSKVQFHVARNGDEWTVKTETRAVGRYTDRVRAIAAAIDLANAAAKAGRCAEVTETEGPILQTIWSFGKDLFPSSLGKPKDTRTRGTYRMPFHAALDPFASKGNRSLESTLVRLTGL
jgi:hypothetical protein